ncbi:hypothetical protein [Deinococcus pimensis]|uniref:hypothetical protein n=1 Tax=Deinococcus pimensis TaxID=309888 RepID=UPI0004897052|nr:hypothetical protein [Deinococcus pimensis]
MTNVRKIVTPVLAVLLVGTTLAGAQTRTAPQTKTQATTQTQQGQTQQRPARAPLTVKFYAGNPLRGGKLLSSATVQPLPRGDTTTPSNPFAKAPAGATYVTVSRGPDTQVMTLKDAQANPFPGGRDGRGPGGRGGPDGDAGRVAPQGQTQPQGQGQLQGQPRTAPNGGALRDDRGGNPDVAGLRLRGLRDASSVTFYAGDPLAGGKAQTTIKLGGTLTAQQQQALTTAASKAKFAVIERSGGTTIVDLTARRAMNR